MKKKNVIVAAFDPTQDHWAGIAIQMGTPGTHDNYNVVYNGTCIREFFPTEEQAKTAAFNALKEETKSE